MKSFRQFENRVEWPARTGDHIVWRVSFVEVGVAGEEEVIVDSCHSNKCYWKHAIIKT